jgi:hypothetical protein
MGLSYVDKYKLLPSDQILNNTPNGQLDLMRIASPD